MKDVFKHLKPKSRQKLIDKLDNTVSKIVRTRDGWRCVRCHKCYVPPTSALHCSHYFSRRYMGTRWDLFNLDALCYGCHRYVEGDKQGWYKQFKAKQLGEREFEYLQARAYGITKYSLIDLEMLLDIYTKQLSEITS